MPFTMTCPRGETPKRGDLLQTNCGDRRERTWFILRVRKIARRTDAPLGTVKPRFDVWRVRWWELESDFRIRLYRSAERRGGQVVWFPEPKTVFENFDLPKTRCWLVWDKLRGDTCFADGEMAWTDTKWWHEYAMKADEIRFVKGRLHFNGHKTGAPFPSVILVFRCLT
jgi:hypothetical protein